MVKPKVPMTLAEALETGILTIEWARDEYAEGDVVWRNNLTEAIKTLDQHKLVIESEGEKMFRTKGNMSLRQLNAKSAVLELGEQFTMLVNDVVNSNDDIPTKEKQIRALTKEYQDIVASALSDKAVKIDSARALSVAVAKAKTMFGEKVAPAKKKKNPFYPGDQQVSFESALFKNGRGKK